MTWLDSSDAHHPRNRRPRIEPGQAPPHKGRRGGVCWTGEPKFMMQ
jgi:hypothetical protein